MQWIRAIPMCGSYRAGDEQHVLDGIVEWAKICDRAIVYLRLRNDAANTGRIEALADFLSAARAVNPRFELIGGMEVFQIPTEQLPATTHRAYEPDRWHTIATLVGAIMKTTGNRNVFLVHEGPKVVRHEDYPHLPAFAAYKPMLVDFHETGVMPADEKTITKAMRPVFATGARLWFDQPVDVANSQTKIDSSGFVRAIKAAQDRWGRFWNSPHWAIAQSGSYYPNGDDPRVSAFSWQSAVVGQNFCHNRFFVAASGRWPGYGVCFGVSNPVPRPTSDAISCTFREARAGRPEPVWYVRHEDWITCASQAQERVGP